VNFPTHYFFPRKKHCPEKGNKKGSFKQYKFDTKVTKKSTNKIAKRELVKGNWTQKFVTTPIVSIETFIHIAPT
jgi:hypothetical protein